MAPTFAQLRRSLLTGRHPLDGGAAARWALATALTATIHSGLWTAAACLELAQQRRPRLPIRVQLEVQPAPEPTPLEPQPKLERAPPAPAAPQPTSHAPPRLTSARAPASPTSRAPAPAPDVELDLSGLTLTSQDGTGPFTATTGSGLGLSPTPSRQLAPREAPASEVGLPTSVRRVVALKELSARPQPPNLNAALRRHYPPSARLLGLSGEAVVRARIGASGRIERTTLLRESHADFGTACARTLRASTWTPPLDRDGQPVATHVRYTCRFRVDPP